MKRKGYVQLQAKMSEAEKKRLDNFFEKTDVKRGVWIARIIAEALDREAANEIERSR